MFDLGTLAGAYVKALAAMGGIDFVANLLNLALLAACVALAFRGPALAFGAATFLWTAIARLPAAAALLGNPDEAQILAGTSRLFHDPVFWRSVDGMTSGPLNYYPLAALHVFGFPLNFPTARAAAVLCLWGGTMLLWLAAREFLPEWAARLSVLPWLAAAASFRFGEFLQYSSECVPLLLGCLAVFLLVKRRWLPLAIVLVAMPLAKLQALPLAAVLAVPALLSRKKVVPLAALASLALLVAALLISGAWPDFYQSYIRNNLLYANTGLVQWTFGEYLTFISQTEIARFLLWISLWAIPVLVWRRTVPQLGWIAAGLLAAALYAVYRPGRPFPHYLLFVMLPATVVGMVALAAALNKAARPILIGAAFIAVTIAAPTLQALLSSPPDALATIAASSPAMAAPILSRISAWARPGDFVSVWGWAAELNVLTATVPAARDPQSQHQIEPGPQRDYYRHRYVQDLRTTPPVVFADAVGPHRLVFQNRATEGYESVPELRAFIDSNYDLTDDVQGVRVFARKGARPLVPEPPVAVPLTILPGSDQDRFHYGGAAVELRDRSMRVCRSTCEYAIPLANGTYRVRLQFVELGGFEITVNNSPVREPSAELPVTVTSGRLVIAVIPKVRDAAITRIEVEPASSPPR